MKDHRLKTNRAGDKIDSRYLNTPGKHCDGGGLYLDTRRAGQASYMFRHKTEWRSLGSANVYSIKEARDKASKMWDAARHGENPFQILAAGRARPVDAPFGEWLTKYLDKKQGQWAASNAARERRDHERTFGQLPSFTALPVKAIDAAAKQDALEGLGKSARRKATSWIEAVIRYAETGVILQRGPGDDDDIDHHEAMPYRDVPAFYAGLPDTVDANALRFAILTGARTDEVIGSKIAGKWKKLPATWGEIGEVDGNPTWIIPKTRFKTRKMHQVPLTPQMIALLGERGADDAFVFKASSDSALLITLRKTEDVYTVHGFRSSFEDWAAETTDYPRDLVRRCTGHDKRTKTDKAYQRSKLLAKRREIVEKWNDHVTAR
jgi:integrase